MDGGLPSCKRQRKPKPNLMPVPPYCRKSENEKCDKEYKPILEVSDPGKILLLTESLINISTIDLEKKLNVYVENETFAELVFIIKINYLSRDAVVQVLGQKVLDTRFCHSITCGILKQVIDTNHSALHELHEFESTLQHVLIDLLVPSQNLAKVVTVPILSKLKRGEEHPLSVLICVVNSPKEQEFITKVVSEAYRFCLPILDNTTKLEEESRIKKQCQSLLHVARKFYSHLDDLNGLLREIMSEARRLANAERCSLFLLDPDHIHLVAKVFDGVVHEHVSTEVRIAKDQGIAGHVALTGKLLNIKDAYSHPLFYKGMDEATGFRTRNILCFPIKDEKGIIGVAQLCNKIEGDFDFFDEEIALAFSIYCGLSIMQSLMYKKMLEAMNRSQLSNELMLYHMKVPQEDVAKILLCTNRHAYLNYDSFNFIPKRIRVSETPCQLIRMFEDLHFFDLLRIKRDEFVKFSLYVKKGYRDTPYHNWMHAFSVTHFGYVLIKQLDLIKEGYLTPLEAMAFLVSCMCHDIDHRGTTNSFQSESGSVLANLYSSEGSVMEHHHLAQSLHILNTDDCNFVEGLCHEDYLYFLDLLKKYILATDLAHHFNLFQKHQDMVENGFNKSDPDEKYAFMCLLMTCCDLSDQVKPWEAIRVVALQLYNEFFKQGDLEKSMGKTPAAGMNRDEACIPDLQMQFATDICIPIFTTLASLFPKAEVLINNINRNVLCWKASKVVYPKLTKLGMTSLEILNSTQVDDEVKKFLKSRPSFTNLTEVFDYDTDADADA